MRILMIHGRSQGGRSEAELRDEWGGALTKGLTSAGSSLPQGAQIDLPFYGDLLDAEVARMSVPLARDISRMGDGGDDLYERFLQSAMQEIKTEAGIDDAEVRAELPQGADEMGPQNWEWVQAIIKVIDRHVPAISGFTIEVFLRDVFLYLDKRSVRRNINRVVQDMLTDEPTVVVAHSLGTVVAYDILRDRADDLDIRGLITLGSPLGIKAVSAMLGVPENPVPDPGWYNAYDERDVVALNPLDDRHFPALPPIENNRGVRNHTDNRHSIGGYLDDAKVAAKIAAWAG